jgi:hypothetical protein
MLRSIILMISLVGLGTPTLADLSVITDKSKFVAVIKGKTLQRVFMKLNISLDGKISGRAVTRPVAGDWQWNDGYFCRSLFWGRRDLGYNCQEVSLAGRKIRFTSDKGEGDYADFILR